MATEATQQRIPIPEDFAFEWDHPTDERRFFERELQHLPGQMTTLEAALARLIYDEGFNGGCTRYELPVRNTFRRINTYGYQAIGPVSHDQAELEEIGRRAEERVGAALDRILESWETEYLPEVRESIDFWESFDVAKASNDALVDHLDETRRRLSRAWVIHFYAVIPVLVGMSMFDDLYAEVLGDDDRLASFRLLQGLDNHTLEADRALYALSRSARVG